MMLDPENQTDVRPAESWYSDAALAKQAQAKLDREAGKPVRIADLCGILEPRVQPTEAERCVCCGSDARGEDLGRNGKVYCSICLGRDHDEDDD